MSSPGIGLAHKTTGAIVVLAAVASAGGLLDRGLYTEQFFGPAMRGQDLLTLLALPLLALTAAGASRGSARSTLVWIGLLGYVLYTYIGAAFAYRFNRFFLLYLALFSLSLLALVAAVGTADVRALHARTDASTPRKPIAVFLALIAAMLTISELGQIVPALRAGTVPELIRRSEGAGNFIYALDLGVVAPLALVTAVKLWRASPWGDLLAGCLLIKSLSMGLALLCMTWFSTQAGKPLELGLTAGYAVMTLGASVMSLWFFRHFREPDELVEPRRLAPHG